MPVSTQRKFTRTSPSIACDKSTTPPTPPNPTNALSKVLLHPPKNFWEGRVEGRSLGEGAVKIAAQSEPICDAVPFTLSELRSTLPPRESEGLVYSPSQKPFGRVEWSLRSLGEGSLKSPTTRGHLCISMHLPLLVFSPAGRHMPAGRRQPPAPVRSTPQARTGGTRPPGPSLVTAFFSCEFNPNS